MDEAVEVQVQFAADAIRAARKQPEGFDHRALVGLTERVKATAPGATLKERRAYVKAVGEGLQREAGAAREVTAKGHPGKLRLFKDPDGQAIHDFGTMLVMMAKRG